MTEPKPERAQLQIFRSENGKNLMASECMSVEPMTELQIEGFTKLAKAGYMDGESVTVLVEMPGFSLTYAWLKKDYPLTRHSHDSDCMYYIIAGSLQLGTEKLEAMDCIFVPANVPYTYTPGPDGVEVLEVRHEPRFNFRNLTHNETWWKKAEETCLANHADWKTSVPPSQVGRK